MNMQAHTCPDLETPRLLLRKLSLADAGELFEVFSDEETTRYVPRERHEDRSATVRYIENIIKGMEKGRSFVWSVIERSENRVIGTVNLYFKPDRAAGIGSVIHSRYWGKGFATEALHAVVRFGFTAAELIRIEGKCESSNAASEKVMKKLGMTYEGTLRKDVIIRGMPRDAKMYSLLDDEYMPDN